MKLIVHFIVLCAVLHIATSERDQTGNNNTSCFENGMLDLKLESILLMLEALEHRLQKMDSMQLQLQKIEDHIQQFQSNHEQSRKEIFAAIQKIEHQGAFNFSELNNHNLKKANTTLCKLDRNLERVQEFQYNSRPSSCKNDSLSVSGTYMIRVKSDSEPFKVYCEQKAFGGGWIVFQHRFDGSLDFYRGWNEFRDGFGDLNKEFWLGLEKVRQITRGRKHELIVELKHFEGTYTYARYDSFEIGSESDRYKLKVLGSYSGTAGDAMSYSMGRKFSTKDRDNDVNVRNCAKNHEGAWWHKSCTHANLNGRYYNAIDLKSMFWYYLNNDWQGLSYSRMMIRELE
ncbi:microfibril-associated glycoprotein 4-like [Anopheles darlingi]|uniref:microfibril-associated glycoprotein 4-like n=1 Tax=Anopheles darlingi TaxID=43151 RepID=UPI0021004C16|nr:microfibril-associated glycoprotein 4-like [Anopheles darlingi]